MGEYNEIKITNEYSSRNEYQTAYIGTSVNPIPPTPPLIEPNIKPQTDTVKHTHTVKKQQRRVKIGARVLSAVIAVAGATMVGVSVADELDLFTPIVQVIFAEQNAQVEIWEVPNGISFTMHIVNYAPLGELSLAVLDKDNHRVWEAPFVSVSSDTQELATQGYVENLSSGSEYTLCLYEDNRLLWSRAFQTEETQPISYLLDNAEVSLEPTVNEIFYSIALPEYTVVNEIAVTVKDPDGTPIAGNPTVENATEENAVYVYGSTPGLSPSTTYTFCLLDGDRLLYETTFTTDTEPIAVAPTEAHLSTEHDRVIYYMVFPSSFAPQAGLTVRVGNEAGISEQAVTPVQSADGWLCDGYVAELNASTEYSFTVLDGDTVLYQSVFVTDEEPLTVDMALSPYANYVAFSFTLSAPYEEQSGLMAKVVEVANDDNTYETEVSLEEDDNGVPYAWGLVSDLAPETAYTFYLYDGEVFLHEESFSTLAMAVVQPEVALSPSVSDVSFVISLPSAYQPQNGLQVRVDESINSGNAYEAEVGLEQSPEGDWIGEGVVADLTPETAYVFYIYDGDVLLYEDSFTTLAPEVIEPTVSLSPSFNSVGFTFTLPANYSLQGAIRVVVEETEDSGNTFERDVSPMDWGNDLWGVEDEIADLSPETPYNFYIYDGESIIYQTAFATIAEPFDPIYSVDLTAHEDSLDFTFSVDERYDIQVTLSVAANDGQESVASQVGMEENPEGGWIVEGSIEGLTPSTAYTFYVLDGEDVIYQEAFTTEAHLEPVSNIQMIPNENGVGFTFSLNPQYEVQDDLRVEVMAEGDEEPYVVEIVLEEIDAGVYGCTDEISDLLSDTTYTFYIYDGEEQIYIGQFTTLMHVEPISDIQLTPDAHSIGFRFTFDQSYTIQDFISFQVYDGNANESVQVNVAEVDDVMVGEGVIEGLEAATTYNVYVYDGWEVIYYGEVTTSEEPTPVLNYELTPDVYGVTFTITLVGDYEVQEGLTVVASSVEDPTNYMDANVTPQDDGNGNLIINDYITDIPPGKDYDFYLYDGEEMLLHDVFTTLTATASDIELTPDSTSVAFSFKVDYANALDNSVKVVVSDGENTREDYPSYQDTGIYNYRYEGTIADLTPATAYTFTVYDGERVLWQGDFDTQEP